MNALVALLALTQPALLGSPAQVEAPKKNELLLREAGLAIEVPSFLKPERRSKGISAEYSFLIEGSKNRGRVLIGLVPNDAEPETFQTSFAERLKSEGATVVRQWILDLLDGKFAATKLEKKGPKGDQASIQATFFRSTPKKMSVEVTTDLKDVEKAETVFNRIAETIRTLDGSSPTDPVLPAGPKRHIVGGNVRPKPLFIPSEKTIVKSAVGDLLVLHDKVTVPEALNTGGLAVKRQGISVPVVVELFDANRVNPESAFNQWLNSDLAKFKTVTRRSDRVAYQTRTGLNVLGYIHRVGSDPKGAFLASVAALVSFQDVVALVSITGTDGANHPLDEKNLRDLLDAMSLQRKP